MRILAFDTTCSACTVAVWHDGVVESAICDAMKHGQAEALVPAIEKALAVAGRTYGQLDRIAVTCGPGSFTGVRVGLATARGLGTALGRPVIGELTTTVLAAEARSAGIHAPVCVAIDARRAELYVQTFDDAGKAADEPACLLPQDAAKALCQGTWHVVGDGSEKLAARCGPNVKVSPPEIPSAVTLAALAADAPLSEHPPGPVYVRPPDAVLPKDGGRLRP